MYHLCFLTLTSKNKNMYCKNCFFQSENIQLPSYLLPAVKLRQAHVLAADSHRSDGTLPNGETEHEGAKDLLSCATKSVTFNLNSWEAGQLVSWLVRKVKFCWTSVKVWKPKQRSALETAAWRMPLTNQLVKCLSHRSKVWVLTLELCGDSMSWYTFISI